MLYVVSNKLMDRLKIFSYSDIIQPTQFSHRQSRVSINVPLSEIHSKDMATTAEEYEKKYQRLLLSAGIRQGATQNILPTHTNRFAAIK